EVDALVVETVPAGALRSFPKPVEERFTAVRIEHVVLTRDEKDGKPGRLEHLLGVVKLLVARELRDVSGMNNEIGLDRQRFDLGDRLAECRSRIGVRRLVEPDMAVAQLDEGEWRCGRTPQRRGQGLVEADRAADPTIEREQGARSCPRHAFQKIAAALFNFRHSIDLRFKVSMPVTRPACSLFPRLRIFYQTPNAPLPT